MSSTDKTPSVGLNKYKGNEFVQRQNFVNDNVRIDNAIAALKSKVNNITLIDSKISVTDNNDKFVSSKLDEVLDEIMDKVEGIKLPEVRLVDTKVSVTDAKGKFYATKLDGVLDELDDRVNIAKSTADNALNKANGITLTANKVSYSDTTGLGRYNVQTAISALATTTSNLTSRVSSLENEVNDTVSTLNAANNSLENDIGNPL